MMNTDDNTSDFTSDDSILPVTEECHDNGTKRIYFRRRESMLNSSLVIINFEGILGEIQKYPIFDINAKHGLYLRQGVIKGIKKLMNKFQVVLVSSKIEQRIREVLNYFKSEGVYFDGVYTRQENEIKNDIYFSYSQIFEDFKICPENVKWEVLILWPILLENSEIKMRESDELLYDESVNNDKFFHVRNIFDYRETTDVPVTLLVPHLLSQPENKWMCFSNIVTLIESLYIASATEDDDKIGSPVRKKPSYKVTTKHFDKDKMDISSEEAPKSHFLVMNTISISPQNHFRKIQKRVYNCTLDTSNTSWVHGFNSWLKYELFSAKLVMSHQPKTYGESTNKNLNALSHKMSENKSSEYWKFEEEKDEISNPLAIQLLNTLKARNTNAMKARQEYYNRYFNDVNSIFDKKLTNDEDSCSDEEGKSIIQLHQMNKDDENTDDQRNNYTKCVTRARNSSYRFIVTPGFLYESHPIIYIKEIS